ncbi:MULTISPECIES: HP0729 family protein [unclassified Campylobacter]|uniref:HP0729 family protein n=1 Tax=unclassified Campylobacter TaxID=2593542 RepID=UPI0022E9D177|nr:MULTISPECIES: HP0729 family protein [unclassified Campylobacter]MDA3056194.1 ATP-binding protein [Campylobacter sp. CN_NA1]MDA3065339.1 ATP-binding protein [Campylobacter sp. CN_NE4]MDA3068165.1 ATP-binding protein [Campylobacter sp. CN_NE3]MDA3082792.1 ATP-binding protein [Campylobacter sp. CN_EL2]MDA3083470.1 ATP-binding protein [Campylobacter sp. CN_NE1]
MQNILILYNPYFKANVIEEHLKILLSKGKVAFGKVRAKDRDMQNLDENALNEIYAGANADENGYFQLFLSDFSSLYVAKVIAVKDTLDDEISPSYYADLEVEKWFILGDLRELVRNDFESVRDDFLSGFLVRGRTYRIYGNDYVYPLVVEQKNSLDYFSSGECFYKNVYKSAEFLGVKENLARYCFGDIFHILHIDSVENLVSAEIEYLANKDDKIYDFSAISMRYSKVMELEIYEFVKILFKRLCIFDKEILAVPYSVQGKDYTVRDMFEIRPNLGTYKFLFNQIKIKNAIKRLNDRNLENFLFYTLLGEITALQSVRNASVHEKKASLREINLLRSRILGIGRDGAIPALLREKRKIDYKG